MTTISIKAIESRVRRRLARNLETLHKCKPGSKWYRDVGDYYAADYRNYISRTHINIVELARDLGLIGVVERVDD